MLVRQSAFQYRLYGTYARRNVFIRSNYLSRTMNIFHRSRSQSEEVEDALKILDTVVASEVDRKLEQIQGLSAEDVTIAKVTAKSVIGGMRGIPSLLWDTSTVDPEKGIEYRGLSIEECLEKLPKEDNATIPDTESLMWFLLTSRIGTLNDAMPLKRSLTSDEGNEKFIDRILTSIDGVPDESHPVSQFMAGILGAGCHSKMAKEYRDGQARKDRLWRSAIIDGLELLYTIPIAVGYLYRKRYHPELLDTFESDLEASRTVPVNGNGTLNRDDDCPDWAGRLAKLMGLEHPHAIDAIRLYVLLHADHEGGNVSAHLAHTVASAHSDLFLAFTAALCGLSGPLHGLANQESLKWQRKLKKELVDMKGYDIKKLMSPSGIDLDKDMKQSFLNDLENYIAKDLKSGRVIPGFGHAVLRVQDPRYTVVSKKGIEFSPDDDLIRLNLLLSEQIPLILKKHTRTNNPFPNIDFGSGIVLSSIGVVEEEFHTVLFGAARAVGIVSSLVWSRLLKLPIDRPKSITLDKLQELVAQAKLIEK